MFCLLIQIGTIIPCFVGEQMLRYDLEISGPGRAVDCEDMEYQRVCRAFIHVIFADSSKGVCPVICLQYLQI